jgi:hypothetical protein
MYQQGGGIMNYITISETQMRGEGTIHSFDLASGDGWGRHLKKVNLIPILLYQWL